MAGLPQPAVDSGAHRDLVAALHELHHRAGWPSLRTLARTAGCSHTTVSAVFSSPRLPTWGLLEVVVRAMDGDVARFRELWLAAGAPEGSTATAAPRLAGRQVELGRVRRHLADGPDALLLVSGEAGIGKTRLVDAAAELAAAEGYVARGACLPLSSAVALLPVASALRSVYDVDGGRWLQQALDACPPYVRGTLSHLLPELDPTGEVGEPADTWWQQRMFAAVGSTLAALPRVRPLAVLIEDLHWADPTTLDLLEALVTRGLGVPVVGTYRLHDRDADPMGGAWLTRMRRANGVEVVDLRPLTREETADQLAMLATGTVERGHAERIYLRTRGHPFYTEQLALHEGSGRSWPPGLADLLDHRLDGLAENAWAAARALAVTDRALSHDQLGAVTGLVAPDLISGLHQLRARRLLDETGTPGTLQLAHPLFAEAVRRHLVPPEAAAQHRDVARVLADSTDTTAAEVAAHWQAAGDTSEELTWRIRAAREAGARFALRQEGEHWVRALDLWPPAGEDVGDPPVRRLDVAISALDVLGGIDVHRAAEVAERAMAWLPDLSDEDASALLQRAGDYRAVLGDTEGGRSLLDAAISRYEAMPPTLEYVKALYRMDDVLRTQGLYAEAAETARRSVEVAAGVGDEVMYRRTLALLAWHDAAAGRYDAALAGIKAAAAVQLDRPDPRGEINLAMDHTDILLMSGASPEEVAAAGARGIEAAAQWDLDNFALMFVRCNMAIAWNRVGDRTRAGALLDPLTGGPPELSSWPIHAERGVLDLLRGRLDDAASRLRAVEMLAIASVPLRVELAESIAEVELWRGTPEQAWETLVRIIDVAAGTDAATLLGPCLVLAARAAADLVEGAPVRGARARDLHARVATLRPGTEPLAPDVSRLARAARSATWDAETGRLLGEESVETWASAAHEWDECGRPHAAGYCRWRAAQVARRSGQGTLATRLLRRAALDAKGHEPLLRAIGSSMASASSG